MPLNIRRRFADSSRCGDENATKLPRTIRFFHPGYGKTPISSITQPPIRDALISLPAFDDGGIHYDIAHTTCGILSGNRWDGYFSLDRQGNTMVEPPVDGILRETAYFFCLPQSSYLSTLTLSSTPISNTNPTSTLAQTQTPTSALTSTSISNPTPALSSNSPPNLIPTSTPTSTDPYPVVARFRDWRFPHGNLPPCWERLKPRFAGAKGSVRHCILTDCGLSLDAAHLVPIKESNWYNDNGMMDYGQAISFSTETMNASTNIIPLRTDIHRIFDERNFCFVPKLDLKDRRTTLVLRNQEGGGNSTYTDGSINRDSPTNLGQHDHDETHQTNQQASSTIGSQEKTLVTAHVFNLIPGGELQKLFHNREAYPGISTASLECLFARFAWTIFSPNVFRDFLSMTKEPRLLLVWDENLGEYVTERTEVARCILTFKQARARSESPTKRQRPTREASEAGGDDKSWSEWNEDFEGSQHHHGYDSSAVDSGYYDEVYHYDNHDDLGLNTPSPEKAEEEEPERGRTRKRKHSESY